VYGEDFCGYGVEKCGRAASYLTLKKSNTGYLAGDMKPRAHHSEAIAPQTSQDNDRAKKFSLGQPFLKWAGGKRQLLPVIKKNLPPAYNVYFEPFVGAGAVLLDLQPATVFINDVNEELINCYNVIRDMPIDLVASLKRHKNTKEYFYKLRELDRTRDFHKLGPVERASRIIYLNKTCYNGLFRVNKSGQYNTPFGRYKNPNIVNAEVIMAISHYLNNNDITILNGDFTKTVKTAKRGDFVYFDPPYDPVSNTSSFTGYSFQEFGRAEQIRLRDCFEDLTRRGCSVMLSNSSTDFIAELYSDYKIIRVPANRSINSVASKRGKIDEFLILNYNPE
jgi:DNA adenine methylase